MKVDTLAGGVGSAWQEVSSSRSHNMPDGVATPARFDALIGAGRDPGPLSIGYYAGGAIMFARGLITLILRCEC